MLPLGVTWDIEPRAPNPYGSSAPAYLSQDQLGVLNAIPGVRVRFRPLRIVTPGNAVRVVRSQLGVWGLGYDSTVRDDGRFRLEGAALETALREAEADGVLARGAHDQWLQHFQRRGLAQVCSAGGGHLWWDPGAGKSVPGLLWALLRAAVQGSATLVVTRASIRLHMARQVALAAGPAVEPWVSDPHARARRGWESPQAYLDRMATDGRPAVWIVGWEEIAPLAWAGRAYRWDENNRPPPDPDLVRALGGRAPEGEADEGEADDDTPPDDGAALLQAYPGVGPKLAAALLAHFTPVGGVQGDLLLGFVTPPEPAEAALSATVEQLREVPGVGQKTAEALRAAFDAGPQADTGGAEAATVRGCLQDFAARHSKFDLVLDEVHHARSFRRREWTVGEDGRLQGAPRYNRAYTAEWLSRGAGRVLATTGSPIPNLISDLWGPLDLVEPDAWGTSRQFAIRYAGATPNEWGGLDIPEGGGTQLEELALRLGMDLFVQRTTTPSSTSSSSTPAAGVELACPVVDRVAYQESHGALPPKRREVVYLPGSTLSRPGAGAWDEVRRAKDAASRLEAQLAYACSRKRPAILDMVREATHAATPQKVVVFSFRRRDVEDLARDLAGSTPEGPPQGGGVWWVHGGHSTGYRDGVIQAWLAAPAPAVLVASAPSVMEGQDLQDADLVLMGMLPVIPQEVIQLENRVHRQGQLRPVLIRYLVARGTVDEVVVQAVADKLPPVGDIMGAPELAQASRDLLGLGSAEARARTLLGLAERLRRPAVV